MNRIVPRAVLPTTAAMLLAALLAQPVAASGPTRTVIDLNDPSFDTQESADITAACGFGDQIVATVHGRWTFTTFGSGTGAGRKPTAKDHYVTVVTYLRPLTGARARYVDVGTSRRYRVGSEERISISGRLTSLTGTLGLTVYKASPRTLLVRHGREVGDLYRGICASLRTGGHAAARTARVHGSGAARAAERSDGPSSETARRDGREASRTSAQVAARTEKAPR